MTPPDARVLIVAALILAGVPVALHEYRLHAHHSTLTRGEFRDARGGAWDVTSANHGERIERGSAPGERPAR
jgi:hypothetical protein